MKFNERQWDGVSKWWAFNAWCSGDGITCEIKDMIQSVNLALGI